MTGEQLQMCFAQLGDVVIAFDASSVARFADASESSRAADVDAAGALDIELGTDLLTRRWAIVDGPSRAWSVALGTHLELGAIAPGHIRPLPLFVRELTHLVGLVGLVPWESGFAFVVDLRKLAGAPTALADT